MESADESAVLRHFAIIISVNSAAAAGQILEGLKFDHTSGSRLECRSADVLVS